jgi:hypothetical protein
VPDIHSDGKPVRVIDVDADTEFVTVYDAFGAPVHTYAVSERVRPAHVDTSRVVDWLPVGYTDPGRYVERSPWAGGVVYADGVVHGRHVVDDPSDCV